MMDPIKVLIADDHQVVRQGLCTFLELHEDIVVVGEADNGATAVEMAVSLAPDVVLMDLVMPKMDGVTCCAIIKQDPATRSIPVIMVSNAYRKEDIALCWKAGSSIFPSKNSITVARAASHSGECVGKRFQKNG